MVSSTVFQQPGYFHGSTVNRTNQFMENLECSREHWIWLKHSFYLVLRTQLATYNLVPFMWDVVIKMLFFFYRFLSKWPWRSCADDSTCDSKHCLPSHTAEEGVGLSFDRRGPGLEPKSDFYCRVCACTHRSTYVHSILLQEKKLVKRQVQNC